jgi:hypothetical protein
VVFVQEAAYLLQVLAAAAEFSGFLASTDREQ